MNSIFIFLFLILFPFGQIIRIGIVQPIDVVVGLGAVYAIIKKFPRPEIFKYLNHFLFFALVSWVFSIFFFKQIDTLYGLLYLIRLAAYFYFFIYVYNFVKAKKSNSKLLVDSLLALSLISAVFGWVQFFTFPDLKPFFTWGWDMHLFRLVGTFLDPTFLGLIIVFGLITTLIRIIVVGDNRVYLWLISLFLLISLAFTYSRASYLAFIAGIGYLLYAKKKIGYILYPILVLGGLILVLPTSKNHSIEFLRSFSAIARIENYQTTIKIFQKSPVFGIGYDNMCIAYQKYVGPQPFSSHACSGSDSSLLFVLATTGVLGLIVFFWSVWNISRYTIYDIQYTSCLVALIVHSTFSNSIFYSWIMGYMIILLAVTVMKKN